ncbi:uncharacterized protein LOC129762237 [Toxorhynchites rutilus septentrionalis]|uniref:uncharacterized protein LOC129762237 n=1 Tax=Toxorhynchites rutilus septentrionalis TaxID=329112 RepID=UPI00247A2494|nr:uncharacterized protein LOC129762237 [Toxorhynchites rutilus septentrionalis]
MSSVIDSHLHKASASQDNICRLCCGHTDNMTKLFPENKAPNRDLLWMILECTTLRITFNEDSTAQVCQECIQKVNDFCEYRLQCLRNDKKLKYPRKRRIISRICSPLGDDQKSFKQLDEIVDDPLENNYQNSIERIEGEDSRQSNSGLAMAFKKTYNDEDNSCSLSLQRSNGHGKIQGKSPTNESINQHQKLHEKKKRFRKVLLYEGYAYQLLSSRPKFDSITWSCCWRKLKECKGTIGTKANGQILGSILPQHNHPPEPFENKEPKTVLIHAFREVDNVYLNEPYEIIKNRTGGDVLLYGGDRYTYSHSRKDGCRIWKCNSHRSCTVSIYLCIDGRIFKLADSVHSKDKIQSKRERSINRGQSLSDISANVEEVYPNPSGTFNYKIIKNANKRNVLIYQGDRYSFYYRKTNGWIVWRCTVSKVCQAMIYQLADESVVVLGETTHNHLKSSDAL